MAERASRHDVVMAGIGGGGVQLAGRLLAEAGLARYKHVALVPSYGIAMRGGASECTVILSADRIASPLVSETEAAILFDSSLLKQYEGRVRPGGVLLVEKGRLEEEVEREDIEVMLLPALEEAVALGEGRASNLILLGSYVAVTKAVPPELIEKELEKRFQGKGETLALNRQAFSRGLELGKGRSI